LSLTPIVFCLCHHQIFQVINKVKSNARPYNYEIASDFILVSQTSHTLGDITYTTLSGWSISAFLFLVTSVSRKLSLPLCYPLALDPVIAPLNFTEPYLFCHSTFHNVLYNSVRSL
jgi:hypothetical protein